MKRIAATTALVSLLGAPAFAGAIIFEPAPEPPVTVAPPPPPPVLPVWTGPYVGAQLGWGRAEAEIDNDLTFDQRDDDFIGGIHAGYDHQFAGGFVLGGELAYDRANMSPFADGVTVEVDNVVRLTARGGFGFGNTLLYAKGGATWLDGEVTIDGDSTSASDWGWVAGAGVEHRITPTITGGVETLFHRVTDFEGFDVDVWTVQARLSYRF